ncbi:hypothetical protein MRX96_038088 [Rhipicephalus microplus]
MRWLDNPQANGIEHPLLQRPPVPIISKIPRGHQETLPPRVHQDRCPSRCSMRAMPTVCMCVHVHGSVIPAHPLQPAPLIYAAKEQDVPCRLPSHVSSTTAQVADLYLVVDLLAEELPRTLVVIYTVTLRPRSA